MKIKAVCEITGLTDRTIRYYIEQNLIAPIYTENYLGRKTFDFSEKDIDELKSIATLRKFDFTIEEIREIIFSPENSKRIIESVKSRIEKAVLENEEKLSILVRLNSEKPYTIFELAEQLTLCSLSIPMPKETSKRSFGKVVLSVLKAIFTFIIVWLPIFLCIFAFVLGLLQYEYPRINTNPLLYVFIFLSLLPSVSVLVLSKINFTWKRVVKIIALALCILSLPFCFIFSLGTTNNRSITTDIKNYRKFDAECLANKSMFFQELFPLWANERKSIKQPDGSWEYIELDSRYYYRFFEVMDYTYDIYAQWPLEKEEFDEEVARVKALFEEYELRDSEHWKYPVIEKGSYTCLFRYQSPNEPFTKATDSYEYFIFAYDEDNLTVRYIYCDSLENGADQPYYLELEW